MSETGSAGSDDPTAVTIFGRTYHLRGASDNDYLSELAELVDGKMREVTEETDTADTLKVSILASLNIADDYLRASRGRAPSPNRATEMRLANMVSSLDEALAETGTSPSPRRRRRSGS
jgi:cell division protein ZapA (FtsZ GTPase activity inhibitor)